MRIQEYPVIVVVWGMDGCPSCAAYIPIFRQIAEVYGACVPAAVFNASAPEVSAAADYYGIAEVPTTMVLRYGKPTVQRIGELTAQETDYVFQLATIGLDCQV